MLARAACHIHSEWSYDGKWTLHELAREFSRRGYQVLLLTEHDQGFSPERLARFRESCAAASTSQILLVPGIEYSDASNTVHILVWGPVPFLGENLETFELLERVEQSNGVSVLAHPSRRDAWKRYDAKWGRHLLGIEIWNRKTDGWAPSERALSLMHEKMTPFVGMDFHTSRQMFPLSMALDLGGSSSEESVVSCLRAGRGAPFAFGRPLTFSLRGTPAAALRTAERCRRSLARAYRRALK